MGAVENMTKTGNTFSMELDFAVPPPPTPNQVFEKHLVSYNVLCGTRNAITPKNANNKALHGWWKF
jgi:hypothetical protein